MSLSSLLLLAAFANAAIRGLHAATKRRLAQCQRYSYRQSTPRRSPTRPSRRQPHDGNSRPKTYWTMGRLDRTGRGAQTGSDAGTGTRAGSVFHIFATTSGTNSQGTGVIRTRRGPGRGTARCYHSILTCCTKNFQSHVSLPFCGTGHILTALQVGAWRVRMEYLLVVRSSRAGSQT